MTEAQQQELFALVIAAYDAKGTDDFAGRIEVIEERWRERYDFWLIRARDRAKREGWHGGR
jgi:hypothetical protein